MGAGGRGGEGVTGAQEAKSNTRDSAVVRLNRFEMCKNHQMVNSRTEPPTASPQVCGALGASMGFFFFF